MSNITITNFEGQLVVDSRLIAEELGIQHKNLLETIKKHLTRLERKNTLAFKTQEFKTAQGNISKEFYYYLNEYQATLLMTFSRNTEKVLDCKERLVNAFFDAKEIIKTVIPQQSEEIEKLKLQNTVLEKQLALRQLDHAMLVMHGKETVLALRGMADQIVETEKPTIEVIDARHNVTFKGQTLVQVKDYVLNKYGVKFKSGADIKRFLEKKNEGHLIAQTLRSVSSEYIPEENLEAVYKILQTDSKQLLLGE